MRCSINSDGKSFFVGAMAVVFSQKAWLLLDFVHALFYFPKGSAVWHLTHNYSGRLWAVLPRE